MARPPRACSPPNQRPDSGGVVAAAQHRRWRAHGQVVRRLLRSWRWRVAVEGHSMEPTLHAGDWLLVDPAAYRTRSPTAGELVVAVDPRMQDHWLVKRVADVGPDGRLALAGDHPAHVDDGEAIGAVGTDQLIGRPWWRYWPLSRFGRLL